MARSSIAAPRTRHRAAAGALVLAALAGPAAAQSGDAAKPDLLDSLLSVFTDSTTPAAPAPQPPAEPSTPPSLATARWLGFTAVIAADAGAAEPTLAGPFPEAGTQAWVTDTVSGLTTRVRLVWREAGPDGLAELSAPAAEALGLAPGSVANVAIYAAE